MRTAFSEQNSNCDPEVHTPSDDAPGPLTVILNQVILSFITYIFSYLVKVHGYKKFVSTYYLHQ